MALKAAAQRESKTSGMPVSELMNVFYFHRLAARVFTADPDGWLIKGGQALLVRYAGEARLSGDIDLQCASPSVTATEAADKLIEAAQLRLEDFLSFSPTRFEHHSDIERGGAQHFDVYLGTYRVSHVKVDLSVGRTLAGLPESRALAPAVDIDWPVEWPQARLYPVIDHVADKLCAMYERHPGGAASSRYRDLADLLLLSQQETLNGVEAHQALHREAARRSAAAGNLQLPESFKIPDPSWSQNYPAQAKLVHGLKGCRSLDDASAAADIFATPLLAATATGTWRPHDGAWQ